MAPSQEIYIYFFVPVVMLLWVSLAVNLSSQFGDLLFIRSTGALIHIMSGICIFFPFFCLDLEVLKR